MIYERCECVWWPNFARETVPDRRCSIRKSSLTEPVRVHSGKTKNGSLRRRVYSVNRLLVGKKDKRKGWTRMAQDWDGPVCRSAFSLTVWCSTAVAGSRQEHCTSGFLWRFYLLQSVVGLVIERSRLRIRAGAAGEFSSPGSTFCADSYFGIRSTPVLPQ